jgi:hypothetical protein
VTPLGRLKVGIRAARRRRYGYAALRVMRRALAAAVTRHIDRSIAAQPYASQYDTIYAHYARALAGLRRRFPHLDFADPRGLP